MNSRRVAAVVGLSVCAAIVAVGAWLMVRNDNMTDFNDLRAFTSAEHQQDRCAIQAAFDAQVKIREFFEQQGGLSDEQADGMAPLVGLTSAEMKSLVGTRLYPMNYDCEVAVASSQEVSQGMLLVVGGIGLAVGSQVPRLTRWGLSRRSGRP